MTEYGASPAAVKQAVYDGPPACEEDPLLGAQQGLDDRTSRGRAKEAPPVTKILLMSAFSFPLSVMYSTMGAIILPSEALRLYPGSESLHLGLFLFMIGISNLVCPVAGLLTDRLRSKWGRRRPFIVLGSVTCCLSCIGLWTASQYYMYWLFYFCLLFSQCSMNLVFCAQASLIPDSYSINMGKVSGIISTLQLAGQLFGVIYVLLASEYDFHHTYGVYFITFAIASVLVVCTTSERSTDKDPPRPITWDCVRNSYWIDAELDRDFFWVFVGRTLFYMATGLQTFFYFYLRDMIKIGTESEIRWELGLLTLIAVLVGVAATYPLGKASDKCGRKIIIYLACFSMALAYSFYALCPLLEPHLQLIVVNIVGAIYGFGVGGYLSVDYALALDCLPDKQKGSSEALGLWGVSGFIGMALGPALGGLILESFGGGAHQGGYSFSGYFSLLMGGVICLVISAYVTSLIKKAK